MCVWLDADVKVVTVRHLWVAAAQHCEHWPCAIVQTSQFESTPVTFDFCTHITKKCIWGSVVLCTVRMRDVGVLGTTAAV